MGALSRAAAALLLLSAPPVAAAPIDRWRGLIEQASIRFGVPARWIEQVIQAESGGLTTRDGRPIRSRAGAIGLMQLMPATWATMRARLTLGDNPDDPADNIMAGTGFLRLMYDRFGYPGLFGAYNAGPGKYARALAGEAGLPTETKAYLAKLSGAVANPSVAPPAKLFAVRYDHADATPAASKPPSLFAIGGGTP